MRTLLPLSILILLSCNTSNERDNKVVTEKESVNQLASTDKIKVLNLGTFHMGYTSDAHTTEFDENDRKNQEAAHDIARRIAEFKPTKIVVERVPERTEEVNTEYQAYLKNTETRFERIGEIQLIAFEVGRLCRVADIHCIDHYSGYNFNIGNEIENSIDSSTYKDYFSNLYRHHPYLDIDSLSLIEKLRVHNSEEYLNSMLIVNATMLTHAGTDGNFEGADEAAKYYQRNLRMFSNLNRIPIGKEDRVFIIMGTTHTAFFRDFFREHPKYEMVNTLDYLKLAN